MILSVADPGRGLPGRAWGIEVGMFLLRTSWSVVAAVAVIVVAPAASLLASREDRDEVLQPFLDDVPVE